MAAVVWWSSYGGRRKVVVVWRDNREGGRRGACQRERPVEARFADDGRGERSHRLHDREAGTTPLRQPLFCSPVAHEARHVGVGQTVIDVGPLTSRFHEPSLPEHAQMCARVLDGRRRLIGQQLDRLLALGQEIEELDALRARQRVSDAGKLCVQQIFELAMRHHHDAPSSLRSYSCE